LESHPNEELPAARPQQTTALYDRMLAQGAVMGDSWGLETPLWFATGGAEAKDVFSFHRSNDFEHVRAEVMAVRNRVGVTEISNFAKYEITGPGARDWLSYLMTNAMPATGRIILTPMLNENGKTETMIMGCYGIGVTRIVAASIEQNHDDKGIIWPAALAPFQISIVPINYHNSDQVRIATDSLYKELTEAGYDVLLDDRKMRAGAMFADHELIGIPYRFVASERGLKEGQLEFKSRSAEDAENVKQSEVLDFLADRLGQTL